MNHFEEEAWFDYVRSVISPERGAIMHRHLDDGCAQCQTIYNVWLSIVEIIAHEGRYDPPDAAVQAVIAAFDIEKKSSLLSRVRQVAGRFYAGDSSPELHRYLDYLSGSSIALVTDLQHT